MSLPIPLDSAFPAFTWRALRVDDAPALMPFLLEVAQADQRMMSWSEADLRQWEWRYFWKVCQGESLETWRGHSNAVSAVAVSPDGKTLASSMLYGGSGVTLWDASSTRKITGFQATGPAQQTGVMRHMM